MRGQKHTFRIRKFLPIIGVVGILAVIGGVFAFNQDSAFFNNPFGVASYESEFIETFESPADWETCQEVPKTVVTKNNSTGNFKVRLSYEEYWRNAADSANLPLVKDGETLALINFQNENDWTRHGNWYYYNYEVEPGDSTNSLFKSVTLNCDANLAKYNVCVDTPTGKECTQPENEYEAATYHLNIKVQTTSGEFPHDEQYHVTLDPNGGSYNGSTDVYDAYLQHGTVIDLTEATYSEHEIVDWTLNGTESYTEPTITITDDTDLVANWQTTVFHTVTVDPNGGSLDGETQPISTRVREGDNYTLTSTEPELADHLFTGWTVNGQPLANYTFPVMDDVTITANWGPIIAQNARTSKLYTSLTNAEAEAQSGDTIKLVANDEEHFINTKNITLDLNEFVVSGSVTNNGTMTLLNGEIRNEDGVAFTNNGTLTMGIDDHIDENTANIDPDYVRLIGATTGLDQNGTFYYYDGYIEGEFAFDGGYNGSPSYRNAYDGKIVYYFPLVDKCRDQESCQHVELASSDLAHSKTTVGGDIYYYNIQENINNSMRTGYKIYIARGDNFATGYGITIPEGADITIDLDGNEMTMTDAITVNGKLTIEDNKTTVVTTQTNSNNTPVISGNVFTTDHDDGTTTTTTYAGMIHTPQTTVNNGELVVKKARLEGTSGLDSIQNNGTLSMEAGAIGATNGYTIQPLSSATHNLDINSYFYSTSTNKSAVYLTTSNFTWSSGNIHGVYQGAGVKGVSFTIAGGKIKSSATGVNIESGSVIVDGGDIEVFNSAQKGLTGVYGGTVTINSGNILVKNTSSNSGGYAANGIRYSKVIMNGGKIEVDSAAQTNACNSFFATGAYTYGVESAGDGSSFQNGTIILNNHSSCETAGVTAGYQLTFSNMTMNITSVDSSVVYGLKTNGETSVTGSNITVTSTGNPVYGIHHSGSGSGSNIKNIAITNSAISATASNSSASGVYMDKGRATINGGKVFGSTYGIFTSGNGYATLGNNDGDIKDAPEVIGESYALYGNSFEYYDGILRGETAFQEGVITAVPDATTYRIEQSAEYEENCRLVPAAEYLQVGNDRFNSLQGAYNAITGDSGTIYVIDDVTVESALPGSPSDKTITFDLNGHVLTYSQPLINNGTMIFKDGDPQKRGKLLHPKVDTPTIENNGNLTIESGYITAGKYGVLNNSKGVFTMNDGTIISTNYGIYNVGASGTGNRAATTINGGNISGTNCGAYLNGYSDFSLLGGTLTSSLRGIDMGNSSNVVTIDGGDIDVANNNGGTTIIGIYGNSSSRVNIASGNITVTNANNTDSGYRVKGITSSVINMTGGKIEVNSASLNNSCSSFNAYGTYTYGVESAADGSSFQNGTIILNNHSSCETAGVTAGYQLTFSNMTMNITSVDSSVVYGLKTNGETSVTGSNITVTSTGNPVYGIHHSGSGSGSNIKNIAITNSAISATASNSSASGVYMDKGRATINGGKVFGSTYGIFTSGNGYATLGNNDGDIKDVPEVIGESYALYGNSVDFYDGTLKGGIGAYQDGVVKSIASNSTIRQAHQTIDSKDYEVRWLVAEFDVAKIGEDRKFKQLSAAISSAGPGETIDLLADCYVFEAITISAEKDFSIKTNGYRILLSEPIANNGKLTINNDSHIQGNDIEHYSSRYAITNNSGATLSLGKVRIGGNYGIENKGTLSMDDAGIVASNTALKNIETVTTSNNILLSGGDYSLYNDGGVSTVSDATLVGKYIYNNSGELTISNSTATKTNNEYSVMDYFVNNGTMHLVSSQIDHTDTNPITDHHRTIYNTGTISLNNTSVSHTADYYRYDINTFSTILNNGGTVSASESDISLTLIFGMNYDNTGNSFAIYSPTGSVTVESGSVYAYGRGKMYGIYTDTGNITIGVPEPTSSPHYGDADADVKVNIPTIQAISTATGSSYKIGVGIKNNGRNGKVYYYDGRIAGSSAALPEDPTETEFHYEVCREMDTSVTPNLEFTRLFWVREGGQPTCTNE